MSKNLFQDIKIKTSKRKTNFVSVESIKKISREPVEKISVRGNGGGSKYALWSVAIFAVIFLIFAVSMLFSSASVTVNPKEEDINLNSSFTASKDVSGDGLSFHLITLSGQETKNVPANGTKDVAIKATGKISIYNKYSSTPQILAANTKLEGSNGKIYKTDSKVTIPGILKDGNPGSVEVGIHAFLDGAEYNSDTLDFKIQAFKGTPKYAKFYGRSEGNIAGGFKGAVPQIPDADKTLILADLQTTLQAKLLKQAEDQLPDGFILLKNAIFLEITPETVPPQIKDGNAVVSLNGKFYGFIFNEKNLTKVIVSDLIPKYDGSDVFISNIKNLIFSLASKDGDSFSNSKNITFTLIGNPKIVWRVDVDKLSNDLLGSNKTDFNNTLSKYTNIVSADLVVRPAWKSSFPDKKQDLKVMVNYP